MDIPALISATSSSLTFVKDALKLSLEYRIETESRERVQAAREKLGDLQESLFQEREELFRLQIENDRLRAELKTKDEWASQKAPYTLTETAGVRWCTCSPGILDISRARPVTRRRPFRFLRDLRLVTGMYECPSCKAGYPIESRRI